MKPRKRRRVNESVDMAGFVAVKTEKPPTAWEGRNKGHRWKNFLLSLQLQLNQLETYDVK